MKDLENIRIDTLELASILAEIESFQFMDDDKVKPVGSMLAVEWYKRDGTLRHLNADNVDGLPFITIKDDNNVLVTEDEQFRQFDLTQVLNIVFDGCVFTNKDIEDLTNTKTSI